MVEGVQFGGAVRPPWETAPTGVVSLLAMLKFAAVDFMGISHSLGILLGANRNQETSPSVREANISASISATLSSLMQHTHALGMHVTDNHIAQLLVEMTSKENRKRFEETSDFKFIGSGKMPLDRALHHIETIHKTMIAELDTLLFKAIPKERTAYCDSQKWLRESRIPNTFPASLKELERAGNCYALGEATACVFHSMRALEPALSALAARFTVSFQQSNWQVVIDQIESEIRKLGSQPKSQQKMEDEKFFGAAASHFYFMKNAWRNHVAHTRDSYSDVEALNIMQHTTQFIESLSLRLNEATA